MPAAKSEPIESGVGQSPVRFVTDGRTKTIVGITSSAFVGGLAEALFLVTVTRAAFAITEGKDEVGIVAGHFLSVNATLLLAFVLIVVRMALGVHAGWLSAEMATRAIADVRGRIAGAFLSSSWSVQQQERSGNLQELLTTFIGQASVLITSVGQLFLFSANLLAMLGLAIAVDPAGAVVLVLSVALLGSLLQPLRKIVRRRAQAYSVAGMEFATAVNEVAQLGLELHVFHVQDEARRLVDRLIDTTREKARRLSFASGVSSPVYSGLAYLALVGALAVVSVSASAKLSSLGAVMLVMLRSLSYGQGLQAAYLTISSSTPAVATLQEKLQNYERGRRHDGGVPVQSIGEIQAAGVTFAYVGEQEVIRDLSFCVESREIIGIVGPSGGGKSTLVQLLLGLRDPQSGRITADGRDIREFDKAEWARKVTFVPQTTHLIAGTIADNIQFLRPDVSENEVERAARLAYLHDDIVAFPEGYQRQVGEHGGHLSGGQQQRLCIARALVESPDVLILDEPTSALDVRSEHLIRTTLLGLKERMTIIVIAHRLSTLDICDRIMVIQSGELRGFDTPANLEQSNEFYREALILSGMR